jgi:hypothetical protein
MQGLDLVVQLLSALHGDAAKTNSAKAAIENTLRLRFAFMQAHFLPAKLI